MEKNMQPFPSADMPGGMPVGKTFRFDCGDANHWQFNGTATSLRRRCLGENAHVPVGLTFDERQVVRAADGLLWEVWGEDAFGLHARRERSQKEREAHIDAANAGHLCSWFSCDRMEMCLAISFELMSIAECMTDKQSRSLRRELRIKMRMLGDAQWMLTAIRDADLREVRRLMAEGGVPFKQRERSSWIDAEARVS